MASYADLNTVYSPFGGSSHPVRLDVGGRYEEEMTLSQVSVASQQQQHQQAEQQHWEGMELDTLPPDLPRVSDLPLPLSAF